MFIVWNLYSRWTWWMKLRSWNEYVICLKLILCWYWEFVQPDEKPNTKSIKKIHILVTSDAKYNK